ncbi:hypothetical protein BDF22DRAFT_746409 [Syncephalis plumigaleata]|nr:hypothetical protein BDF22DRAFT_746409 [Syncephalis plumigaleata]
MAFSIENLKQAPFYLATIAVAFIGFFLALIGTAIARADAYAWLTVFYTLIQIIAVAYCVGSKVLPLYRLALLTCLAVNIMLAIQGANSYIYGYSSSTALIGAGFVFITLIELLWAIVIGSEDSAPPAAYPMHAVSNTNGVPQAHTVVAMPAPNVPGGVGAATSPAVSLPGTHTPTTAVTTKFAKDEVMDIADNKGKWWHARKADGSIGVVPSNYLELVGPSSNA